MDVFKIRNLERVQYRTSRKNYGQKKRAIVVMIYCRHLGDDKITGR